MYPKLPENANILKAVALGGERIALAAEAGVEPSAVIARSPCDEAIQSL
jgi:hypothetical protein